MDHVCIIHKRKCIVIPLHCQDATTAMTVIHQINSKMTTRMKELGQISNFMGLVSHKYSTMSKSPTKHTLEIFQ